VFIFRYLYNVWLYDKWSFLLFTNFGILRVKLRRENGVPVENLLAITSSDIFCSWTLLSSFFLCLFLFIHMIIDEWRTFVKQLWFSIYKLIKKWGNTYNVITPSINKLETVECSFDWKEAEQRWFYKRSKLTFRV